MQITDSIADLLTRIRNASSAKHDTVEIPASNMKRPFARFLRTRVISKVLQLSRTASRASSRSR